ncbi:MAG: photosynthetic reaction center cytochrome PufC, partial [Paracraurococcus sp.]
LILLVPEWTHPPIPAEQFAPPPASLIQFGRGHMAEPVPQEAPPPLPPAEAGGPRATEAYRNVQVLTDVSAAEFMRLQQAITQWVSPEQGCGFCHAGQDYASDAKPQKQAARVMLRMVRHVNADRGDHVRGAGVTCYTCHRGHPVPAETWLPSAPRPGRAMVAAQDNWRESAANVRQFFPDAGWDLYLLGEEPISVQSTTTLPGTTVATQVVAKRVYEMMMQMSDGIGVNCGYCHNSRALQSWEQSTPHRWEGQYGLNLTRDLNRNYLLQLFDILPQSRELVDETRMPALPAHESGVQAGNGLVLCATCHYANPRPLNGAAMAAGYPGLGMPAAGREAHR